MGRPGQLHIHSGGLQGGPPLHNATEDMHEQQSEAAQATLCIREHRYALTKDLSKFYQKVDADPVAQNLRRVMWKGGDTSAKMKVYITTTVNFGDKPAGCIAIAAARGRLR